MADEDLDNLGGLRDQAVRELLTLEDNPYRGRGKAGQLRGTRALAFNMPGGAYRAAYVLREDLRRCVVFMVGPHENFYREAERRYTRLKKQKLI
jgi:hypothetical protein